MPGLALARSRSTLRSCMQPQVRATCKHLLVVLAQQTSPCWSSRVVLGVYAACCSHIKVTRWQRGQQGCENPPAVLFGPAFQCVVLQEAARTSSMRESKAEAGCR